MKKIHLATEAKIISASVPKDINATTHHGDYVSLKNYAHASIVIQLGAWAGGTSAITLAQASDVAGTGSKALGFSWMWTGTALTDDSYAKTAVTSNTFNVSGANTIYIIELDAAELDTENGFDCFRVEIASPGANADLIAAQYILSGLRHACGDPPSAIID